MQTSSFSGNSDNLADLTLQEDGKLVAVGYSYDNVSERIVTARYNTDGLLDNSFSEDGKQSTSITGHDGASAVTMQKDGKIVVAGYSNNAGLVSMAVLRYTAKGIPDSSFAHNGIQILTTGLYGGASSVLVQMDGRIVVGGSTLNSFNRSQLNITRLLENGMPDTSFSSDGQVIDFFGEKDSYLFDMLVQNDGKLLVTGYAYKAGTQEFLVVRYNIDGTLDHSFAGNGFLMPDVNAGTTHPSSLAFSMAVLHDGKIILAGSCAYYMQYAVVRLNPDGSMDNSFATAGILRDYKAGGQSVFNASAVQTDGRLVTAGQANGSLSGMTSVIVARYNTDGSFDRNFSGDGKVIIDFPGSFPNANAMAIQQDGKIVVAGSAYNGTNTDFMVLRLKKDGSMDNTFGNNGIQMTDFGGYDAANGLAIQPDGKILLAGYANNNNGSVFTLVRYNTDGNLDNSFNGNGKLITSFGLNAEAGHAIILQPDGKIIAVGNSRGAIAIARYNSNGSQDVTFNGNGLVITALAGLTTIPQAAVLNPKGEIIIAGASEKGFAIERYNSNGSLDNGFSDDGVLTIGFESGNAGAASLVLQPDGKLIAGGEVTDGYNTDFALARINTDGTLDSSFADNGKLQMDVGNGADAVRSLSIYKDRLYAVGSTTYGGQLATVAAFLIGCPLNLHIPDAFALRNGVFANTVYPGYAPAENILLSVVPLGGKPPFTYAWSNGATTASTSVRPASATAYSVTVYDARGCSNKVSKQVNVVAVSCGNKENKVMVCRAAQSHFSKPKIDCISLNAVDVALKNGAYLGNCDAGCNTNSYVNASQNGSLSALEIYPNPSSTTFNLLAKSEDNSPLTIIIWDAVGRLIETIKTETNRPTAFGAAYKPGIYFFELIQGRASIRGKLVKN
jgi:uncharacterized delta-60 repeat protein